ncbi:MAG TPA: hypothetical protein VN611_08585 [Patescibacteria group bacterium]|nr:hypothetical protein [Patescibacteria group bacterium]
MKKMLLTAILCFVFVGMLGSVASAGKVDWKTTEVYEEIGSIYIKGYFTNNMPDKVIDRINWFQPNLTITLSNGSTIFLDEIADYKQDCWIEPGDRSDIMWFRIAGTNMNWSRWNTRPQYNYHFITPEG